MQPCLTLILMIILPELASPNAWQQLYVNCHFIARTIPGNIVNMIKISTEIHFFLSQVVVALERRCAISAMSFSVEINEGSNVTFLSLVTLISSLS